MLEVVASVRETEDGSGSHMRSGYEDEGGNS